MPRDQQRSALEALLFASDDALSARALYKLLIDADEQRPEQAAKEEQARPNDDTAQETPATDGEESGKQKQGRATRIKELTALFEELIDELNGEFDSTGRAFRIVKVAGGYQFATTAQHGELVARLVKSKSKRRLSQAALETLAIIAYRQPITKPEIESIRGVSCNEVVNTLLEKNLVTIAGRSEAIGKPLLYGTTEEFLRAFGLHDISDLPKPRELEELMERRADILNTETVVFAENENVEEFEERLHNIGKKEEGRQEAGDGRQEEQGLPVDRGQEDVEEGLPVDRLPVAGREEKGRQEAGDGRQEENMDGAAEPGEAKAADRSHEGIEETGMEEAQMPDQQPAAGQPVADNPVADNPAEQENSEDGDSADEYAADEKSNEEPERKMKVVMAVNGRSA